MYKLFIYNLPAYLYLIEIDDLLIITIKYVVKTILSRNILCCYIVVTYQID